MSQRLLALASRSGPPGRVLVSALWAAYAIVFWHESPALAVLAGLLAAGNLVLAFYWRNLFDVRGRS